ncbi:hypothetical protein B4915_09445 [Leucobacter massiliensis]|nr:hypothetical protein B4915_09445 [Leucobacter massiliensis]
MGPELQRLYRATSAPVAFLDESYEVEGDRTFYVLATAVVSRDRLVETREALTAHYDGEPMHAAPMFHSREVVTLRGGIALAARENDGLDLVVSAPIAPGDSLGHAARRRCIEHIAPLLHAEDGVGLFVFDQHREAEYNRRDRFTFGDLRRAGRLPRDVTEHHARPSAEPLLGLPDLLAWAYRQRLMGRDRSWFTPFENAARVHELG